MNKRIQEMLNNMDNSKTYEEFSKYEKEYEEYVSYRKKQKIREKVLKTLLNS